MFKRILIANRGEIALRIIRTCKRLGVESVAIYSDEDTRSPYVEEAEEALYIGGSRADESYLHMERIISAAVTKGCEAVHPGYGFLSENPRFAKAAEASGVTFIGPPAGVIAIMGDKIASKEIAVRAGVPVIPGHVDSIRDVEEAIAAAESIGYPVLLKPAAGGGGKGMRIVCGQHDMEAALAAARQETRKAFGDNRIFMERYIENPRHIEIQILSDSRGNILHLGERECSIQRRYQKLIEESPSPAVSDSLRQSMGRAACELARKAGYVNAGTVEFIMAPQGGFYFLEMNTRLQVEHPVTEMVTGLDLVELQLRIAAGEPLPFAQNQIRFEGWAMEVRVCAEDPARDFIPSTGMITRYAEPRGKNIRVDSGVRSGSKIGVHYDSMMAKVISHGKDRESARIGLVEALNGYHIEGIATNIDFINTVLCHPDFVEARLSTGFIGNNFQRGNPLIRADGRKVELAALAATLIYHVRTVAIRESVQEMVSRIGLSRNQVTTHSYMVRTEDEDFGVSLQGSLQGRLWTATVNGRKHAVETPGFEFYRRRLRLNIDGRVHRFRLRVEQSFIFVAFSGITRTYEIYTPKEWALLKYMPRKIQKTPENILSCPMPGQVVQVLVKRNDVVFRGQTLVILESMKMESGVASPLDGLIEDVVVKSGQTVEAGETLIVFSKLPG